MKKNKRLLKPENYILTAEDLQGESKFANLLNDLTDVSNSQPLHNLDIDQIGICKQKTNILIQSLDSTTKYIPILCEIKASVNLSENRGIHMSRYLESIFSLSKLKFKSLNDFALELASTMQKRQESKVSTTEVSGIYFAKRRTQKSNLESYDGIELISKAVVSGNNSSIKTGIRAHNATACPCTKTYTKYSAVPELKAMGLTLTQIQKILNITTTGTHMQIGQTTLILDKGTSDLNHKQIHDVLNTSIHLVYELLKRPDEHHFVKNVLEKPQFTEDVVREVAYNAYQTFHNKLSPSTNLFVEAVLQDSIHMHDVSGVIDKTFGELEKELNK